MKNMPAMEEEAGSASRRFVGARAARASLEGLSGYRGGTDSPRWEGTLIGVRTSVFGSVLDWSLAVNRGI